MEKAEITIQSSMSTATLRCNNHEYFVKEQLHYQTIKTEQTVLVTCTMYMYTSGVRSGHASHACVA